MIELYIIILSILIAYSPFVKKILLQTFSLDEILCLEHLFYTIPLIIFILYRVYVSKTKLNFFKKVTKIHVCYFSLTTLTALIAGVLYYYIMSRLPVTKVTPILSPLIIIFSVLIGVSLFKETINKNEIIGIVLIIMGIYISKSKHAQQFINSV